jgi:hypothetical protein
MVYGFHSGIFMPIRANKKFNENKLIKILNLLDSPMDGEVLAAAKSAARYLKNHGESWNEVIQKSQPPPFGPRQGARFMCLRDAVILKRTQRARLLAVRLTNGLTENFWFPCSTLREIGGNIFAARWIIEQKEKELLEGKNFSHIDVERN